MDQALYIAPFTASKEFLLNSRRINKRLQRKRWWIVLMSGQHMDSLQSGVRECTDLSSGSFLICQLIIARLRRMILFRFLCMRSCFWCWPQGFDWVRCRHWRRDEGALWPTSEVVTKCLFVDEWSCTGRDGHFTTGRWSQLQLLHLSSQAVIVLRLCTWPLAKMAACFSGTSFW